jgi:hypothetical protein
MDFPTALTMRVERTSRRLAVLVTAMTRRSVFSPAVNLFGNGTAVLNSIESHSQYFGVRLVRRSDSAG